MTRFLRSSFFVLMTLTATSGLARASKTVIKAKGMEAHGSFNVERPRNCGLGVTKVDTISVGITMFESTTTTNGSPVTELVTSVGVDGTDGCTGDSLFDYGLFHGVGNLTMTALQTGKITGHFVLVEGTILDVNLTMTGSDTTFVGASTHRTIMGKTMTIERGIGATRTATLSGTAKIDGQTVSASQMLNTDASLARNTSGEITILKP